MKPLPCSATPAAYAQTARRSTAEPAKPSDAQPRRRATPTSQPPAPPTTAPISRPSASSARAMAGPVITSCAAVPAPPLAIHTNGVAIPSLSPPSPRISPPIRPAPPALTTLAAPRGAAVPPGPGGPATSAPSAMVEATLPAPKCRRGRRPLAAGDLAPYPQRPPPEATARPVRLPPPPNQPGHGPERAAFPNIEGGG